MKSLFERAKERGIHPKTLLSIETFEKAMQKDPRDASAYARIGRWWHLTKSYAKSVSMLNKAIELAPKNFDARLFRADLLGTCPDRTVRNSLQAVDDAEIAIAIAQSNNMFDGSWQERRLNRVLAAALAENGEFERAIQIETQSLEIAITKAATHRITNHIASFRQRKAIRSDTGIAD